MEHTDVARTVKEAIIREASFDMNAAELDELSRFGEDIRVDSITFIRIVISVEEELDVETPDDALMQTQFKTVADLIEFFVGVVEEQHT
ncbi:MAG: acyl carrier protein [Propionibacteriaceae bacterium]|jgi:acyl carrier protein|nr:acyl carrier protein [Propionibacteriaceae bacterium]